MKVNGQVIEGNFTFASAGEVEFLVASAAHSEATATFKLTAVQHFTLTNGSADKVVLTNLPEKALPGESITFGVTLLPGYYLENGVKVLNDAGEEIESHDNGDYTYTFTMPAGNVTITINTGITDFTISKDQELIGDILMEDSEDTTDTFSAVPGTKLKFQAQETVDTSFSAIYVDGVVVTKGEDDYYHFVMPHHPVVISAERAPREYSISANTSSLTLSTLKMYTNAETKAEVTNAHKGQTVYLEFASDKAHVKYFITVKTSDNDSLEVTPSTSSNVFTFVMVSSNITIEIQEEDYSKYYGYYVTDKAWKFTQFGSYSSASTDTLNYTSLEKSLAFESNGSGTWDESSFTWTQEADGTSGAVVASLETSWGGSYEKTFYYTENLVVMNPSTYSSSSWYQVGVGTWNADTTIHALALDDAGTRLFYTVDENDAIKESIVINNSTVTMNPTIYKDDSKTTLAKGSELSLTSNFYVSLSADSGFGISNGKVVKAYSLGVGEGSSEQITVVYKNASGQAITEAKNGDTVTVCFTLNEEAIAAGLSIDTPTITVDDRWAKATLTPVEGEENTYTFVMPAANVTVKALTFNPNLYQGYAVLGRYAGFELYGTAPKDITDYSSAYGKFTREITKAGKFVDPTSKLNPGNVKELTNSTKGTFVVSDELDITVLTKNGPLAMEQSQHSGAIN